MVPEGVQYPDVPAWTFSLWTRSDGTECKWEGAFHPPTAETLPQTYRGSGGRGGEGGGERERERERERDRERERERESFIQLIVLCWCSIGGSVQTYDFDDERERDEAMLLLQLHAAGSRSGSQVPVLIKHATSHWPALQLWTLDRLARKYPEHRCPCAPALSPK